LPSLREQGVRACGRENAITSRVSKCGVLWGEQARPQVVERPDAGPRPAATRGPLRRRQEARPWLRGAAIRYDRARRPNASAATASKSVKATISPRGDSVGAGAATLLQMPTFGGTSQRCDGPSQGEVQHTLSAQNRPATHCDVSVHGPPTGTGVPVGVTVGV